MKNKYPEAVEAHCKIYEYMLEPIVNEMTDQANLATLPKGEEDTRVQFRENVTETIVDKEGIYRIKQGFNLIVHHLDRISGGPLVKKELVEIGLRLTDTLLNQLKGHENEIASLMNKTRSSILQDVQKPSEEKTSQDEDPWATVIPLMEEWKLSPQAFQIMYDIGRLLFSEKKWDDATSVFHFLSILNVKCSEVWFSLALCHQNQGHWPEAMGNYTMAIMTDESNIQAFINLASCYITLNDRENANYTLNLAETVMQAVELSPEVKNRMSQKINEIKKHTN